VPAERNMRARTLAAGVVAGADWSALSVARPRELADERGQVRFGYTATRGDAGPASHKHPERHADGVRSARRRSRRWRFATVVRLPR
jgi:hypothetical protein